METLLIYNLKLSACLILFYILYKLVFSRETFHRANRLILISVCLFSLFVPSITFEMIDTHSMIDKIHSYQEILGQTPITNINNEPVDSQSTINTENTTPKNMSWLNIFTYIYMAGIIIFLLKLTISATRIIRLVHKSEKIKLKKGILILHDKEIAPFSWFNYIIISQDDYTKNGEIIVKHEQAHIVSHHSFDIIIIEAIIALQWYNPFVWLIKRELQNSHEYEADKLSISSGIDAREYQLLLIKEAVGALRFNSITNNFNQNKTKNRITMMLKEKSKPGNRWKYLAIIPFVVVSIALFANPQKMMDKKVETILNAPVKNKDIIGTWKLVKANHHDLSQGQTSIRIITKNNFSWTYSNAQGDITASTGGRYTYKGGVYTEYLDYVSNSMSPWKGKTVIINIEIKNNMMICKGILDGKVNIDEEWIRVE